MIKAYGLGSCVALVLWSESHRQRGLIHIALRGYFADTGIPKVMDWVDSVSAGVRKSFTYRLYGGASILDENRRFDIGRRNALAIKRLLWKYGCGVLKEELGGNASRTVTLSIADGSIDVKTGIRQGGSSDAR